MPAAGINFRTEAKGVGAEQSAMMKLVGDAPLILAAAPIAKILFPTSKIPFDKTKAVLIVKVEPSTAAILPEVLLIVSVAKLEKGVVVLNFKIPILPVPNKVRLEVVLPRKVPVPKIVLVTPGVPIISEFPLMSKLSNVALKLMAFPPKGADTVKLLSNCTSVFPTLG